MFQVLWVMVFFVIFHLGYEILTDISISTHLHFFKGIISVYFVNLTMLVLKRWSHAHMSDDSEGTC